MCRNHEANTGHLTITAAGNVPSPEAMLHATPPKPLELSALTQHFRYDGKLMLIFVLSIHRKVTEF
jgi:hypothetical protein